MTDQRRTAADIGLPCFEPDVSCGTWCTGGTATMKPADYAQYADPEDVYVRGTDALALRDKLTAAEAEVERLRALVNTPQLHDFASAVTLEAAHQRERWGSDHDAGKAPTDWFWLVGYLAGKALHAQTAGSADKAQHHTISTAAALANWHAAIAGEHTAMRPGIDPVARGIEPPSDGARTDGN